MAHYSFSYKGYSIWLANIQPSKRARGGHTRSMQVRQGNIIKKNIRYDTRDTYAFGVASKKATKWIDEQLSDSHA
jgi:hypothetical protein